MTRLTLSIISLLLTGIITSGFCSNTPKSFLITEDAELTTEMRQYYQDYGFLILDGFISPDKCQQLEIEGKRLVSEVEITSDALEIFSTTNSDNVLKKGAYFLESADKIRPFFEESAIKDGGLTVPIEQAVNKLAHAVGEINPLFKEVTFDPRVAKLANQLGITDPRLTQSMLIMKPAKTGGAVIPHQDATFLYTQPLTTLAFWIPLVNATMENACLQAIPGSHTWPLRCRYTRNMESGGMKIKQLSDFEWGEDKFVPLEMKAGSLILFHSLLVHQSAGNTSYNGRPAYTFHIIDGNAHWDEYNWLQRDKFPGLLSSK